MSSTAADRHSPLGLFPSKVVPWLCDCVVEALRSRPFSRRTEWPYRHWIRHFFQFHNQFHNGTHPRPFAEQDLNLYLEHKAVDDIIATSEQSQAVANLLFLYVHALEQLLDRIRGALQAGKAKRSLAVLNSWQSMVQSLLNGLRKTTCCYRFRLLRFCRSKTGIEVMAHFDSRSKTQRLIFRRVGCRRLNPARVNSVPVGLNKNLGGSVGPIEGGLSD
jgi:hypothetical protein